MTVHDKTISELLWMRFQYYSDTLYILRRHLSSDNISIYNVTVNCSPCCPASWQHHGESIPIYLKRETVSFPEYCHRGYFLSESAPMNSLMPAYHSVIFFPIKSLSALFVSHNCLCFNMQPFMEKPSSVPKRSWHLHALACILTKETQEHTVNESWN